MERQLRRPNRGGNGQLDFVPKCDQLSESYASSRYSRCILLSALKMPWRLQHMCPLVQKPCRFVEKLCYFLGKEPFLGNKDTKASRLSKSERIAAHCGTTSRDRDDMRVKAEEIDYLPD